LELSLTHEAQQLTGTLQPTTWSWAPTPVTGSLINGVVHLTGRSEFSSTGFCRHAGYFLLHDLEAVVDDRTRTLTGRLSFNGFKTLSSCYAAQIEVIGRELRLMPVE
jgi:hypothetical protein